jgi:hypothetical protein
MWIVKNVMSGTVLVEDLNLKVPANDYIDLDDAVGREKADSSRQLMLAFEEGCLKNISKDDVAAAAETGENSPGEVHRKLNAVLKAMSSGTQNVEVLRMLAEINENIEGARRNILEEQDKRFADLRETLLEEVQSLLLVVGVITENKEMVADALRKAAKETDRARKEPSARDKSRKDVNASVFIIPGESRKGTK